jgi:hypothetical protein
MKTIESNALIIISDDVFCADCQPESELEVAEEKVPYKSLFKNSNANKSYDTKFSYFNVLYDSHNNNSRTKRKNKSHLHYSKNVNFSQKENSKNYIDFSVTNPFEIQSKSASSTSLEKLKMREFGQKCPNGTNSHSDITCPICMEFLGENMLIKMNCHHIFHSNCILNWLGQSNSCPVCRDELKNDD